MCMFDIERYSRQKVVELESSQDREMFEVKGLRIREGSQDREIDDNLNSEIFNEILKDN